MRNTLIVFLCGVCFFTACTNSTVRQLERIESLLSYEVDSATYLLEEVGLPAHFSKNEQVLYDLLQTHLRYLQAETITSDSIIASVVNYYEGEEDQARLMKACYLQGCITYQLQEIPKAQRCFLRALEVAEKVERPDPALLAKIYNRCGDLYAWNDAYEDALAMNRKSFELFEQLKDTLSLSYICRDIARAYELLGITDSVVFYYEKSNLMAQLESDEELYYDGLVEFSGFLIKQDASDSLVALNLNKIKAAVSELPNNACLMYGQYYVRVAEIDSAIYYFEKSAESEDLYTRAASFAELSEIKKEQGDAVAALNYLENYVNLEQELVGISRTELLVRAQAEYNYDKTERENLELRLENYKSRITLYEIGGIALFVIVVVFYLLRIKIRQVKRQREHNRILKKEKEEIKHLYQHTLLEIEKNEKEIKRLTHIAEQDKQLSESKLREVEKQIEHLQSEQRSNQSTLNLLGSNIRESAVFLNRHCIPTSV